MDYSDLYEYLEGFEKITPSDIVCQIMDDWNDNQTEAVVETLFTLVKADYYTKPSFFNFYANSTLSGSRYPCSSLKCRLKNVDGLARFSALYADKVLVQSPIDNQYEALSNGKKIDRYDLAVSILILLALKPLVLSEMVGFTTSYLCLCPDCFKKVSSKEELLEKQLDRIAAHMTKDLANSVQCTLMRDKCGIAYYAFKGLDKYGFHEQQDLLIQKEPRIIKEWLLKCKNKPIIIGTKKMQELGLVNQLLQPSINDIFQAQITTEIVDSSYLTTRESDAEIINELNANEGSGDTSTKQLQLISKALFHKVPIIDDVTIDSIVTLRRSNEDAFITYRDSINQVLKDMSSYDPQNIRDLQRDIIEPEIHKMKQTIKSSRKALIGTSVRDALLSSAGISIGMFSGLLPIDYAAILGVLGGVPAICKIVSDLTNAFSEKSIKNSSYYFLWKLEKEKEYV